MWPTQWMFILLGLLLAASNDAQVCSNGLAGVERAGACCVAECGTCGGSVCGSDSTDAGLTADDCCIGSIKQANVYCSDSGVAPCLIDDAPTCSNGVFGVEADGVCCVAQCKKCDDRGCGGRATAAGLTEDDCCIGRIMDSNVFCGDSETAPCIIGADDSVCGPVFTITLEWSEPTSDLDLFVTEPDGTDVGFSASVGNAGFFGGDVRSGPGIESYTVFSGLDPAMVSVNGDYQFYAVRNDEGAIWTLVATLYGDVIVSETGDFVGGIFTDTFTASVTGYDPTCENGTRASA